jgi:signal recognition particle receptor subunit beta
MSKERWVVQAINVLVDISYPSTIKEDTTCVKAFSYKFPNPVVVPINKLRNGFSSEIRLELPSHAPSYDTVKSLLQEREAI